MHIVAPIWNHAGIVERNFDIGDWRALASNDIADIKFEFGWHSSNMFLRRSGRCLSPKSFVET